MTINDAFNGASGGPATGVSETAEAVDKSVADVAADAVEFCQRASDLLRSQASTIKSIAITIEAEAEALALDIEKRAHRFTGLVEQFSRLSGEVRAVFEQERIRLDGFDIPAADKAPR